MPSPESAARVELAGGIAQAIHAAVRTAAPRECCGLLEGTYQGEVWRITAQHPARNLAAGADRFEIDPADHFAAARAARTRSAAIVGCYHSHPGGRAWPSAADLLGASLAGTGVPDFLWLIAADGAVGAFVYRGSGFVPLAVGSSR